MLAAILSYYAWYTLVLLQFNPSYPLRTLGLAGTIVAKGKSRAGLKALGASASHTESRESTVAENAQATTRITEEISEPSDEEQVSSEQLQALQKRTEEREAYIRLLQRIKELEQEESDLAPSTLRMQNNVITLSGSRGPRFDKHSAKYRSQNL